MMMMRVRSRTRLESAVPQFGIRFMPVIDAGRLARSG